MSLKSLVDPLERVLRVAASARTYDFRLFFQIRALKDDPSKSPIEFQNLLNAIKSERKLEIFDSATQRWEMIDFYFLLSWMISRGQQVGVLQTIEDIEKYLSTEDLEITKYLFVKGLTVKTTQIINNFTIVPWNEIPLSDTKHHLSVKNGMNFDFPDVAICVKKTIARKHNRPWESRFNELPDPLDSMLDLLKCAILTQDSGIVLTALWELAPEWAPWKPVNTNFGQNKEQINIPKELNTENINQINQLHSNWLSLSDEVKQHLRLPIQRLNSSVLHGFRFVDSAIDLGIAYESTFLSNKEREQIGALIRLRAAKYLSEDFETRQGIVKKVKDVYSLRSSAVHRGTFENESAWRDSGKVFNALSAGRDILRQALGKHVRNGIPNWEKIDLS